MSSSVYNFEMNQGSDYTIPLKLQDSTGGAINLAGYSARMQLRRTAGACTAIDELSSDSDDARILIDAAEGRLQLRFPNAVTEKYPAASLVYDVEIKSASGDITRILQGTITVSAEVTRDSKCKCSCSG